MGKRCRRLHQGSVKEMNGNVSIVLSVEMEINDIKTEFSVLTQDKSNGNLNYWLGGVRHIDDMNLT
jgi:hypothetical protein